MFGKWKLSNFGNKAKETSPGLVQWFKRNDLTPTMDSERDMQTFKQHAKIHTTEHEVRK